jgi:hypothetical protein
MVQRRHASLWLTVLAIAGLAWLFVEPAGAAEPESLWGDWRCGQRIHITRKLVDSMEWFAGMKAAEGMPAFLVGSLPATSYGALLFVKDATGWRGYALQELAMPYGVYLAPKYRAAIIFTMLSTEGPGKEYSVFRTRNGFRTGNCSILPAPTKLGTTDYMEIKDFNIGKNGRGAVAGTVSFAETDKTRWYRAKTMNWGKHWTRPTPLNAQPPVLSGIFRPAAKSGLDDLIDDLKHSESQ